MKVYIMTHTIINVLQAHMDVFRFLTLQQIYDPKSISYKNC